MMDAKNSQPQFRTRHCKRQRRVAFQPAAHPCDNRPSCAADAAQLGFFDRVRPLAMTGFIVCFLLLSLSSHAANPVITEVTSAKGIKAWLVQDNKLPLIAIRFAFAGGVETDPVDKQGLAILATSLMMQGAGPYDDATFQEKLAASSIEIDISAGRDYISGEMKTLSRNKNEAFRLVGLALASPRFDEDVIARVKGQQKTAAIMQLAKPSWQGRYALHGMIYGYHPYGHRSLGTRASLDHISRDDIIAFYKGHIARENLLISVVGDITPDELRRRLDDVFGAVPDKANLPAIAPVEWPEKPASVLVRREGAQTNILFAAPMLMRSDPDWYAAQVANYILGGGSFNARLMKAVRAKGGLTYGISTGLVPMKKTALLTGDVDVDNARAGEALALMKQVWQDFFDHGVSEDEVEAAKDYLIGSAPLVLTSTDAIAGVLLSMQTDALGIDYLDRRDALLRSVTQGDVTRVIRRWFDPAALSFSFVGMPQGIAADKTQEMVKE